MDSTELLEIIKRGESSKVTSNDELARLLREGGLLYAEEMPVKGSSTDDIDYKQFDSRSDNLSVLVDSSIDVIFVSNFFEHLQNKEAFLSTLSECNRVLKSGGVLLILQPNIRFAYREYWDFIDHVLPLSDKSLAEALILKGFSIKKMIPRFLPYSTKSGLPVNSFLVKWYLRLPFAWRIFGKQCFVVASKAEETTNA